MGVGGCVQEMGLPRTTTLPYLDPGVPVSQWERQEPARAVSPLLGLTLRLLGREEQLGRRTLPHLSLLAGAGGQRAYVGVAAPSAPRLWPPRGWIHQPGSSGRHFRGPPRRMGSRPRRSGALSQLRAGRIQEGRSLLFGLPLKATASTALPWPGCPRGPGLWSWVSSPQMGTASTCDGRTLPSVLLGFSLDKGSSKRCCEALLKNKK